MSLQKDRDDLHGFLVESLRQVAGLFVAEHVAPMEIAVRMRVSEGDRRQRGTVSGE